MASVELGYLTFGAPSPVLRLTGGGMYVTPKFDSTQKGHAAGSLCELGKVSILKAQST